MRECETEENAADHEEWIENLRNFIKEKSKKQKRRSLTIYLNGFLYFGCTKESFKCTKTEGGCTKGGFKCTKTKN